MPKWNIWQGDSNLISTLNLLLKRTSALRSCDKVARTLAMDADEAVVVENDEPRSKCQKLTDFFERLPSTSQPQEFPGFSYLPW